MEGPRKAGDPTQPEQSVGTSNKRKAVAVLKPLALPDRKRDRLNEKKLEGDDLNKVLNDSWAEFVKLGDSVRGKKDAVDYSYTVGRDAEGLVDSITLPEGWSKHKSCLTVLIGALIKAHDRIEVCLAKPDNPIEEIDIPKQLEEFVIGISQGLDSRAPCPTEWKKKEKPIEIARQGIFYKRLMAWAGQQSFTHAFDFIAASVSGTAEKSDFNAFYDLLDKVRSPYAVQYKKCVKALLTSLCSRSPLDGTAVLEKHRLNHSFMKGLAKPQLRVKKSKKGQQALKKPKELWEAKSHPLLSPKESAYVKNELLALQEPITEWSEQWDELTAIMQYTLYKPELKKLRELYTPIYTLTAKFSTGMSRRTTLFKNYAARCKLIKTKKIEFDRKFVDLYNLQRSHPSNKEWFAIIEDPRFVLVPVDHVLMTDSSARAGRPLAISVIADFSARYGEYGTEKWTDNPLQLESINFFNELSIEDDDDGGDEEDNAKMR